MSSAADANLDSPADVASAPLDAARNALSEWRVTVASEPENFQQLVNAHCELARVLREIGDSDGAVACYREAICDCETTTTRVGPEIGVRLYSLLGETLDSADRDEESLSAYRMALAFAEQCRCTEALAPSIAGVHNNLGMQLSRCGESVEASKHYRLGLAVLTSHAASGDEFSKRVRAAIDENLGLSLIDQGDYPAAQRHLSHALRYLRGQHGPGASTPGIRRCFERLETVFRSTGDEASAQACGRRAEA